MGRSLSEVPRMRRDCRAGDRKSTSARADIVASETLRPVDFADRRSVAASVMLYYFTAAAAASAIYGRAF